MKPIFIIGYMCSGKTTFGSALSRKTGLKFIDLDEYIEQNQGKTIKEIFADQGEKAFREIERVALLEVSSKEDCIIACGGGTPCHFNNMEIINSSGISVFLETSPKTLLARLIEGHDKRPIVANKTEDEIKRIIESQLWMRNPFYRQASIIWDGEKLETEEEIEKNVESFLETFPG